MTRTKQTLADRRTITAKGTEQFAQIQKQLLDEGYAVAPNHYTHDDSHIGTDYAAFINSQLACGNDANDAGRNRHFRALPMLMQSSGAEVPVANAGTDGLGYITWGAMNKIPNVVALLTTMLPYTAAGWKFNTDLLAGTGPQPMYHYVRYQNGGTVIENEVPYANADVLLNGFIRDLQREKAQLMANGATDEDENLFPLPGDEQQPSFADGLIDSIDEQIKQYQADLERWKKDAPAIKEFCENTGNPLTFLQLSEDENLLGICFPELDINQQSYDDESHSLQPVWQPHVQAIRYRPAHICRLERMDDDGRINYVYLCNRFYDDPTVVKKNGDETISALPALTYQTPLADLKRYVRDDRQKAPAERRTRFILPCFYPTSGRPYYPVQPWHSIFTGDVYEYAATLISDRYTRKRNANVIGRVIYIHNDYLNALYNEQTLYAQQNRAKGKTVQVKTKAQLRDELFTQINNWLNHRDNAGQSLVAFTFTGSDGKDHDSFKIVEIESASKNNAEAQQTELLEISSIIFFAMGLDSTLIGNTPGSVGKNSGTDMRTRYQMKQLQMTPTQKLVLRPWEIAAQFNNWDPHLRWTIKREAITTLDNSKTGLTDATSKTN